MSFLSSLKAERFISAIQAEDDPSSQNAKKAFEKLGKMGAAAVPKVLEALGMANKQQTMEYVEVLTGALTDKSLMQLVQGLASSDPRTVSGTAWALSSSKRYNVNRLLDLLAEDTYSKSAILEVLAVHKDRLNIRQLLGQVYYLQPSEKAAVFKLVEDMVNDDLVPDLIQRMDGKDPVVRMHLINVIAQFDRPDVHKALEQQLKDNNKLVRQAALTGIARLKTDVNAELVCSLLLDPDVDVMNKAVDVIIRLNHPETIHYLIPALKDENEFSRRAAVEILNEIGDVNSIKTLLQVVKDEDWWVRARASDALARIGGPRVVDAVLQLIRDKDEDIRRSAIEILNTTNDPRAVKHLMEATRDEDWWVSERAADALGEIGDTKAMPVLLEMMDRGGRAIPVAIRALGKLGNPKALEKLLPYLNHKAKDVRIAALEAMPQLADERRADTVRQRIQQGASSTDETVNRAANRAMQDIDKRFSGTGTGPGPTSMERAPRTAAPASAPATDETAHTMLIDEADVPALVQETAEQAPIDLSALQPGDLIEGRYQYIEKIGKGAFGTVVLVEDTVVGERLILKFLNPNVASDEEMMKRFVHELRYSRKITHKNVIRIYDFLYMGGGYAISMEYFPSHTLGGEIPNQQPMEIKKAMGFACDIATGMVVAHQQGIIHRDLKPANILINDQGLLKIVDFGVAAAASSGDTQLTKTGYVIGSPKYMAPEQILGKKVDETADIYSLGVILYEMLTGVPPYSRGDHMSVMYQHVQGKARTAVEVNAKIPKEINEIVAKAMSVDKLKRFTSMEEFRETLLPYIAQPATANGEN
jgi:HEAT repeat protein/tRNA A-37 threonylcarbamoyl transferase component Bud32